MADVQFQIFEWRKPKYGVAKEFRLVVKRNGMMMYEKRVDGNANMDLSKVFQLIFNTINVRIKCYFRLFQQK